MIRKRLLALMMVLTMVITPIIFKTNENLIYAKENNDLQINKTAKDNGDGTYTITLDAKGEGYVKEGKKADIVIIIDTSTSMYDKIEEVKKAAKSLANNILESNELGKVKIALGHFSDKAHTDCNLTDDKSTINKKIELLTHGGNTNTKDGIRKASELLEDGRIDAQKYVLFFTDGIPNIVGEEETQNEYKENFSIYENMEMKKNKYPNAKFYTIGVFTNYNGNRQRDVNFLANIQNVISPLDYENKYFSDKLESINGIFNDINMDISQEICPIVVKDIKIHDIVKKEFNIIPGSSRATDLDGNKITLKDVKLSRTQNGEDEINFDVGDIIANKKDGNNKLIGGVRVSFDISKKDPYFGGKQIPTNVSANISYKEPDSETEKNQIYNIPQVDIPYKEGKITIEKEVENKYDDTFEISIFGGPKENQYKYTVDLKANEKATMDFYLRKEETDISNNKDYSKNYFVEGTYSIDEIVPMNYKKDKILVKDKYNDWIEPTDGKIYLNKDNKDINIKVINKISNDMYWNDKVYVENKLKYK